MKKSVQFKCKIFYFVVPFLFLSYLQEKNIKIMNLLTFCGYPFRIYSNVYISCIIYSCMAFFCNLWWNKTRTFPSFWLYLHANKFRFFIYTTLCTISYLLHLHFTNVRVSCSFDNFFWIDTPKKEMD